MQGHHDWSYAYSSLSSGKETVSSVYFFSKKKLKQPGIFLAAKSSMDKLILNLVTSY